MLKKNKFVIILFLSSYFNLSSQSKFLLEIDLISRNTEHYKYLKSSPFSPNYEKFNDISLFSLDLGGEKNYSFSIKYKINNKFRISAGYNYSTLFGYFIYKPHLLIDYSEAIGTSLAKTHSIPLQLELNLPLCKHNKRLTINPVLGINIIYNNGQLTKASFSSQSKSYYLNQIYADNILDVELNFNNKWNFGFCFGAGLEYNFYKGIRMNIAFKQQIGIFEVQRTNFDISHIDKIFNRNMGSTGEWINKQTLKNKSFGILIPMDWLNDIVRIKTVREIIHK